MERGGKYDPGEVDVVGMVGVITTDMLECIAEVGNVPWSLHTPEAIDNTTAAPWLHHGLKKICNSLKKADQ